MVKRLVTSAIGLVIFFLLLFFPYGMQVSSPDLLFNTAVLIIALAAVYEIHNAVSANKEMTAIGLIMGAVIFIGTIKNYLLASIIIVMVVYLLMSVIEFGRTDVRNVYMLGFATVVFACFISTIAVIKMNYSAYSALLPFVFAWITDSGAYFAGRALGRHKLIPKLSPKKTVEGAVGGIIACVLISLLYVCILDAGFSISLFGGNDYLKMVPVSLTASVISQLGDFAASAIKRDFNVKDFGNILPGHGGVLDRFDSIVFVSPFVYCIFMLLVS